MFCSTMRVQQGETWATPSWPLAPPLLEALWCLGRLASYRSKETGEGTLCSDFNSITYPLPSC